MYVPIHGHSSFSFLEAIGSVKPLIKRVEALGLPGVAMCDYHGMYGAIKFYQTAKKADVQPLIGVALPFVFDRQQLRVGRMQATVGYVSFLAQNYVGYQSLLALVSAAHADKIRDLPVVDMAMLQEIDDVYVILGYGRSVLGVWLQQWWSQDKLLDITQQFVTTFGVDNVLLSIEAQDHAVVKELVALQPMILTLAEQLGVRVFADGNFHYLSPSDKEAYEVALAIKDGKKTYDADRRRVVGDWHLKGADELRDCLLGNGFSQEQVAGWMQVTVDVAARIDLEIPLYQQLFPNYPTPDPIKGLYEKYKEELVI